jgi:hypothetical protein
MSLFGSQAVQAPCYLVDPDPHQECFYKKASVARVSVTHHRLICNSFVQQRQVIYQYHL